MLRNIIKNTGIYFFTNLLSQGAVFVFWIIAANILAPAEIGLYALVIFVVDFFGAFAIFGLDAAITRFYYLEEGTKKIFYNSSVIFVSSTIASVAILSLSAGFISWLMPDLNTFLKGDILLFYILVISSSLYNFALVHYSALRKAALYAKISLCQTAIFFILSLAFLFLNFKILGILYALTASYLFSAFIFLFKEIRMSSFAEFFSVKTIKSILGYSIPMALYALLGITVIYVGRFFLNKYTTLSILGIYSFFLTITMQVNALWATFNRAWTPEIFSKLKEDKKNTFEQIKTMAFFSSFLYLLCFAAFVIIGESGLFGLFLKPVYLSNINILYILFLGPLFIGISTMVYPLYYYGKNTKLILLVSVTSNIASIFLTFLMVRSFGQVGAALSYLFSSILSVLLSMFIFRKVAEVPFKIIQWSVFLSFLIVFGVFIFLETSSVILFLMCVFLAAFFAYNIGKIGEKKYFLSDFWNSIKNNHSSNN